MARLRIRVELNRGGVGIPLHKLARVVDEAQKFFHMLAEDVRVDKDAGEWLGFDFDHETLNFTAEFVGPVTEEQVRAFNAAFDGTTPLRRATIGQFARITEGIGEDEVIGFGLYQAEGGGAIEPTEWRALSRRDALRISDEIRVLSEATKAGARSEADRDSWLPAVAGAPAVERIFSERRERGTEERRLVSMVREVEADLSKRISRVETGLEEHAGLIGDLRAKSSGTEDSVRNLLTAVEKFCAQATQQVEAMARPALPAPVAPPSFTEPAPASGFPLKWAAAASVALLAAAIIAGGMLWRARTAESPSRPAPVSPPASVAASPAPAPVQAPAPAPEAASRPAGNRLDIEASEPTWVSVAAPDGTTLLSRLFNPGDTRSLEVAPGSSLRTGNAGGLILRFNGNSIGPIGPSGQVTDIHFRDGTYRIASPKTPTPAPQQ